MVEEASEACELPGALSGQVPVLSGVVGEIVEGGCGALSKHQLPALVEHGPRFGTVGGRLGGEGAGRAAAELFGGEAAEAPAGSFKAARIVGATSRRATGQGRRAPAGIPGPARISGTWSNSW